MRTEIWRIMKIAFLNLVHTDPEIVGRVAEKLTGDPDFDMYIHVDAKSDIAPFKSRLQNNSQVFFTQQREKVYWGGYHAIDATYVLLRTALASKRHYDYFVVLQNLDYPIKSNTYIKQFFTEHAGTEFIRGCYIAGTKDWLYAKKYRLYYRKDSEFLQTHKTGILKRLRDLWLGICSVATIGCDGIIHESDRNYPIYYGTAQWAVTRACAEYLDTFEKTHPKFNAKMKIMQFPDEEYFHTAVHNSEFKTHCSAYDEQPQRWLVNWRNLHYFEFPKSVTTFEEKDFDRLMGREELFIRKVRTGVSEGLLDKIDTATE